MIGRNIKVPLTTFILLGEVLKELGKLYPDVANLTERLIFIFDNYSLRFLIKNANSAVRGTGHVNQFYILFVRLHCNFPRWL